MDRMFTRAIVLLRNPLNAVPSYFNLLYERKHHLPNHSTRGSNEEWREYRDHLGHGLYYQLKMFESFALYWMERFRESRSDLLLVSYEELTSDTGHVAARRMLDFLMEGSEGLHVDLDKIECVWRTVVKFKDLSEAQSQQQRSMEVKANPHSLREGPKDRPYTKQHLEEMMLVLNRLMEGSSSDQEFVRIIQGYLEVVSNTVPAD
jgi:hypothetical protein